MINASKQKLNVDKSKSKTIVISILDYSEKRKLLILIPKAKILILAIKKVDIAIIDADVYYTTCKLKET